jgi:hypothetical protein
MRDGADMAPIADMAAQLSPLHLFDLNLSAPPLTAWYGDGRSAYYQPLQNDPAFHVEITIVDDASTTTFKVALARDQSAALPLSIVTPATVTIDSTATPADVVYYENADAQGQWFRIAVNNAAVSGTVDGRFGQ